MFVRTPVRPSWATYEINGKLDACHLIKVDGGQRLERTAAITWAYLQNECLSAGLVLTYTGCYRSRAQQEALWIERGGQGVATPGRSMHGWGLAVDMAEMGYGARAVSITKHGLDVVSWILTAHDLPWAWEGRIGSRDFEPWHLNWVGPI